MAKVEDIERIFVSNLKRLREQSGMSQEKLSIASKLSRAYVGRIEQNGEKNITIRTISRIARVLGVTVVDLLTPTKPDHH